MVFRSRLLLALLVCAGLQAASAGQEEKPRAAHVVLIVWDGMRPDFVTREHTPHLWALAQEGVTFARHHSVYPSLTSVNATALATGVYPATSGMLSNWAFRPELNSARLARMDEEETVRRGDDLSGGHYLAVPTIAELVQARGGRTAITGTKSASLLHNRRTLAATNSVTLFNGKTEPPDALRAIVEKAGEFPKPEAEPNTAQDKWTTRALTEVLWADGVPPFSLLWMSEPDRSQHLTLPGSDVAIAALHEADANLGLVLEALQAKGVREKTDILLASDHGFSTIRRRVDVHAYLREKGLKVASDETMELARGEVRIAGNGGTNLYYVGAHDEAVVTQLVAALQQSDFAAVIFSRRQIAGTFPLAQLHLDAAHGPDVIMAFRWSDEKNDFGVAGGLAVTASKDKNLATHGSLSPYDLHNTFIAAGPDFRRGLTSDLPTANIDVAATIMHLLQVQPAQPIAGRVVREALVNRGPATAPEAKRETLAAERAFPGGAWRQSLQLSTVDGVTYVDEGTGAFTATTP